MATTPNGVGKGRGRPPKLKCTWCLEISNQLNYVLPVADGQKQFCSVQCLQQFNKNVHPKEANQLCSLCQETIQGLPIQLEEQEESKPFCSNKCMLKYQRKQLKVEQNRNSREDTSSNGSMDQPFDWSRYLMETASTAAPITCFKQHPKPPKNEFQEDMKLEALDPRSTTSMCIATVISAHGYGPRLRLRLDGSDNRNDFWRLVDSNEIHPVGHSEENGDMLQPPLGFTLNVSQWPVFLAKRLNNAVMAPAHIFKTPPPTPPTNKFRIGMKLEAVDKKNPQLICVATVGDVKKDMIYVTFDGWKGAFDYWCRYDSRDIFPPGWCARSGHYLQPPNDKKMSKGIRIKIGIPSLVPDDNKVQQTIPPEQANEPEPYISSTTVSIYLNPSCMSGEYFDRAKLLTLGTQWGPNTISVCVKLCIKSLLTCVKDNHVDTVITLLVEGTHSNTLNSNTVIQTVINSESYNISIPELKSAEELWEYLKYLAEKFKMCKHFLCGEKIENCTEDACTQFSAEQSVANEVENVEDKIIHKRSSPDSSQEPKSKLSKSLELSDVSHVKSDESRQSPKENGKTSSSPDVPSTTVVSLPELPTDPSSWTIEHVIQHLSTCDPLLSIHADLFRSHEIDGKALLLLTSEMMMKYMNLKLGPALKICNIVSRIRPRRHGHAL